MATSITNLTTITALADESGLPGGLVRHWIYANVGGFRDTCTVKVGGRRLIDLNAASAWVEGWRAQQDPDAAMSADGAAHACKEGRP